MAKFIIRKERNASGEIRFAAYEVSFNGKENYVDGTYDETVEGCEEKLRKIVSDVKEYPLGIVKELEL